VEGDVFEGVRQRIHKGKGRIRHRGSDYLLYALMDAVVDQYLVILEAIGDHVETLEEQLLENPSPNNLELLHELRGEAIYLRRQLWPLREVLASLVREKPGLIDEQCLVFFRDVYDHTIQVLDGVDSLRDLLASLMDLYLSSISNYTNDVMRVLTLIATLFIPLTFLAGIYGMNFKFMPELDWRWGYPLLWMLIAATAIVMLTFFKRKRWL
jgi:magnesium transporter